MLSRYLTLKDGVINSCNIAVTYRSSQASAEEPNEAFLGTPIVYISDSKASEAGTLLK